MQTTIKHLFRGADVNNEAAVNFLQTWHKDVPDGAGVHIMQLPSRKTFWAPVPDIIETIETVGLQELVWGAEPQNVYVTAAYMRPGARRVAQVTGAPGVWLDVDVKEGSFTDRDDALVWILGLPDWISPSIIIDSGSGFHCYWKVDGGIEADRVSEFVTKLWLWAKMDSGMHIDKLVDPTRVLRLPGTLWMGKGDTAGGDVRLVGTVRCLDTYMNADRLNSEIGEAWADIGVQRRQREVTRREEFTKQLGVYGGELARLLGSDETTLSGMEAWIRARESFMTEVTWEEILEPYGWRKHGDPDYEERQEWTRPGSGNVNPRSMVTGWINSPNVAKLLSDSPDTGLLRLVAEERPLTKIAVAAELWWHGDEMNMVQEWLRRR